MNRTTEGANPLSEPCDCDGGIAGCVSRRHNAAYLVGNGSTDTDSATGWSAPSNMVK